VFIAGDAAHVMPPTGGFGGNSGVEDGYNLAWKLAYVLDGRAGEELLDTYETERQPVGAFTTEQAYSRYVLRLDPTLGTDDLMPLIDEAAVEIGYRYRSPAVAAPADDDATWEDPREPSCRPGFRAASLPVTVGGEERSTVDLFGRRFVVLAGSAGESWCDAARSAGTALGVPVDTYRVGDGVTDPSGTLEAAYGIGEEGAVLVRPDGFVAWRASAASPTPETEIGTALAAALARPAPVAA
jgi:hypothetical protein